MGLIRSTREKSWMRSTGLPTAWATRWAHARRPEGVRSVVEAKKVRVPRNPRMPTPLMILLATVSIFLSA